MELGDNDFRRRSMRCKQRPSRNVWANISSESVQCECCQRSYSNDKSACVKSLKQHATRGLSMSRVIFLSVVVATISCSIIASASQQQASTIASQVVHRSTNDAETSTHNLSADSKQTRQQHQQNITTYRGDNQVKQQAISDQREPDLISSSTPETLSTTPLAPPNHSTQSSTAATPLQSTTTTPANLVPSASDGPSRVGYVKLLNENGGDLSASSSVNIQSSQLLQPKKSSQLAGGGNRWSRHFGARLRPLTPNGLIDHEAAPSSKATAALTSDGRGFNRSPLLQQQQQLATNRQQQSGFAGQPVTGNSVDNNEDNKNQEEDDDDDDSEALLYKMMQQQNFLMNPIFQEQPPTPSNPQQLAGGGNHPEGQAQQRGQAAANGNGQAQQNDDLASSKKVIKLLKSYSHIHQVDDSDDQIRGTYTRLSSYRPNDGQMSSRDQYSSSSAGNHNNAHNGNRRPINGQANNNRKQQHVFVSSRPVSTSQTREQGVRIAPARQPHSDGNYRQASSAQRANSYPGDQDDGTPPLDGNANASQDGNESGGGVNGSGGPPLPQEEDEFECPNNGIFADVASGCQAYHVCQSGAQVQERFNCPLGTLFNDIILTCDFAHNVQCGKKPGEQGPQSASLQNNDGAYNRQPSQQYQQQAAPRPQQAVLPTTSYPRQSLPQQQQQPLARPASQGPRQLVIGGGGGSPYNQHNRQQQQASSQAAALGSYPAVKPLSNALSDAENDEDDDSEPLVPATLPPRAASAPQPTGSITAPRLPYKAPPAPPATASARPSQQQQQANAYNMPTSIQQQIPHQANRQSAHLSQYPTMQAQQRPPHQPRFHQRPAQQLQNRYVTEASAPARAYGEPNLPTVLAPQSPQQQPQQYQQQSASAPAVGSGSDGSENQSYNLVINHLTAARDAGQQKPQHQQSPSQVQQAAGYSKPQEQQPQAHLAQKVTPVYKSQVSTERQQSRRLVAASYPIGQQQEQSPAQVHHRNRESQNFAVPNQQQQNFQPQQHPGTQRQKLPFSTDQNYDSQRRNIQNNHYQQHQSQHKARASIDGAHHQHHQMAPVTTPAYANEVAAATQRSVSHSGNVAPPPQQQSNVNGLVDLTNGQQSSVGSENLNNGLLLIVRHSSGGPTLQVQNGGAASSTPESVAYAVDPKIINPNSPVDSQLFPNVQQFVAVHHHNHYRGGAAGSVTQASTNRVTHVDPMAAPQSGRYPIAPGSLPPMTPPEPPREGERQQHDHQYVSGGGGGAGEQYGAASDHHLDQQSAAGAIVPAATSSSSSGAKSAQTSPQESFAASTRQKQPTLAHQKPAASNNKKIQQQQQQTSRTKRAKSSKPAAQLPKKLEKRTTSTTTTTTTSATPISAGTTTTTTTAATTNSAQLHHAKSDNKRKQQTLSRGN